jgi:hypothetical protein
LIDEADSRKVCPQALIDCAPVMQAQGQSGFAADGCDRLMQRPTGLLDELECAQQQTPRDIV